MDFSSESSSDNLTAVYTKQNKRKGVDEQSNQIRETLVEFQQPELLTENLRKELERKKTQGAAKKSSHLSDILSSILPPRQFNNEQGQTYIQRVKADASTRDDVIMLQMKLDERLQQRQARESGICPVREELYSQTYDELIRQVAIESSERGLLLMRVRDELKMSMSAYQTLYQSSMTFGMRKSLQAEQGVHELQTRIEELDEEKKKLQGLVQEHKGLFEAIEKRIIEQRAQEEKKMQEEKDFLKFQAQHLESFLKSAMQ